MMSWPEFLSFDLLRGLHIIAVIAWMSGMMYLPRLYAYHTETAPAGSEFDAHSAKPSWNATLGFSCVLCVVKSKGFSPRSEQTAPIQLVVPWLWS